MNPLAFLFAPFAPSGAAVDAPLSPCPDCKTPMRADESCDVCAMLRDYARERDGLGPARLSARVRMGPPPEVSADLRAQLDTFVADLERVSHAPSRALARANDERAYEKRLARQRASAKQAKRARKKQRGR